MEFELEIAFFLLYVNTILIKVRALYVVCAHFFFLWSLQNTQYCGPGAISHANLMAPVTSVKFLHIWFRVNIRYDRLSNILTDERRHDKVSRSVVLGSGVGEDPDAQGVNLPAVAIGPFKRLELKHILFPGLPACGTHPGLSDRFLQ